VRDLKIEHRKWLSAFSPQYLRNWEKIDDEAAMCEAAVRRLIQRNGITIEPNEDLTGAKPRPDFRCLHPRQPFYVEVTCLSVETTTKQTGLVPSPEGRTRPAPFSPLNDSIFNACKGKAAQCRNLDHPTLVAVGTWHDLASMLCINKPMLSMLLTGQTMMSWNIDVESGRQAGETYQTTELYSATFLRRDNNEGIGDARGSISGLLVCGFGIDPPKILGVLNPNSARPFDPQLLPEIEFCQMRLDRQKGELYPTWVGGSDG
jgi:hypothetical protein